MALLDMLTLTYLLELRPDQLYAEIWALLLTLSIQYSSNNKWSD